uniref:Uncharacterized protein n=1 Tax=Rhizophora mucronata TaxID=61149 RepID=A0A2P2JS62_RHIMU
MQLTQIKFEIKAFWLLFSQEESVLTNCLSFVPSIQAFQSRHGRAYLFSKV